MMRNFGRCSLLAVALVLPAFSADLVVEENGVSPNYSSIQDAVTAAAPNDRIFIKNKSGNVPYLENVTIEKPLELLPFTADGSFLVTGDYTIVGDGTYFTGPGFDTVRIVGMENQSGGISGAIGSVYLTAIHVDVLGCQLLAGSIDFNVFYECEIAGNWLHSGSITTCAATICGNLVNGSIDINNPDPGVSEDTMYIVGNRLCTSTGAPTGGNIQFENDKQYLQIANNHIRTTNPVLISFPSGLLKSGGENVIVNNSLEAVGGSSHLGVYANGSLTSVNLTIENNAFHDQGSGESSEYAISIPTTTAGQIGIHYNSYDGWEQGFILTGSTITDVGNVENATLDPDDVTGVCSDAGSIDMGHPGGAHTDHDLSRNDIGVAGGSYNCNNFWPILTGGARVYLVKTPRTVVQGSTINAEADAHDR